MKDGYEMSGDGPSEELQEVEEELVTKKGDGSEADDPTVDVEAGQAAEVSKKSILQTLGEENLKVFTQAFTLTFLAEWGAYY